MGNKIGILDDFFNDFRVRLTIYGSYIQKLRDIQKPFVIYDFFIICLFGLTETIEYKKNSPA